MLILSLSSCISQVSPVYSKPIGALNAMIGHIIMHVHIVVINSAIITYMVSTIVGLFPLCGTSHASNITD